MSKKKQVRVYSYIRFSTPEQENGDSLRRQREWRDSFVKNNGYELDTSFKLLDKGRSAYKDEHRTKGTLGVFLDAVEAGKIPPGSILLVESIDRLTRLEPIDALEMICFGLLKRGITVQTTIAAYPPDAVNDGRIHGLIAEIQRSYMESKRKSELIKAARETSRRRAREEGRPITKMCPEWLRVVKGKYEIIPEAAKTVRMIFQLKKRGLSQREIERQLNDKAPWTPLPRKKVDREAGMSGNGWRTSYIKKILNNRAVIGEYQPHQKVKVKIEGSSEPEVFKIVRRPVGEPIPGYYPQIVDNELFFAVQKQLDTNRGKGGRTGKYSNLFTHIVKCAYCGGPMRYVDKGETWQYLTCDFGVRRVKCKPHSVSYPEFESAILDNCAKLKPEQVLPSSDEQEHACRTIRDRINASDAELTDNEKRIENFVEQIGATASATTCYSRSNSKSCTKRSLPNDYGRNRL